MNFIGWLMPAALLAAPCFAQAPGGPQFEVASIRQVEVRPQAGVRAGLHIDGAQVHGNDLSLREYLAIAYRTRTSQIVAPDWMAAERFDISASVPGGSAAAQIPEMLQALLAERFHIKSHKEKTEFAVYAIETGNPPLKLKESPPEPDPDNNEPKGTVNVTGGGSAAGIAINLGHGSSYSFANNRFEAKKLTMTNFAANLERFADRPIVDKTGLKGQYDFVLEFSPEDYRALLIRSAISAGVSVPPRALQALHNSPGGVLQDALKQVGLKLEASKAPLDVLVVDEGVKTPSEN